MTQPEVENVAGSVSMICLHQETGGLFWVVSHVFGFERRVEEQVCNTEGDGDNDFDDRY